MPIFSLSLRPGERVILQTRQTESLLLWPVIAILASLYIPLAVLLKYELLARFGWYMLAWTVAVALWGVRKYILWLVNAYILTNERAIAVRFEGLTKKKVEDMEISRLTGTTWETTGLISSLLGFGNLKLTGENEGKAITFFRVRDPEKIKRKIREIQTARRTL